MRVIYFVFGAEFFAMGAFAGRKFLAAAERDFKPADQPGSLREYRLAVKRLGDRRRFGARRA
jgi:hypothetical protein